MVVDREFVGTVAVLVLVEPSPAQIEDTRRDQFGRRFTATRRWRLAVYVRFVALANLPALATAVLVNWHYGTNSTSSRTRVAQAVSL